MAEKIEKMENFAKHIARLVRTDYDLLIGVGGMTGSGKSTFTTKLQKKYSEISNTKWSFNNMTWSRKELMTWIDGEKDSPKDPVTGLKKGQMPEYTAILPDELFHMFYRRNWHEDDQIESIGTFNMCRDRHLFVAGNIPDFWDLDTAFTKRVRYYVYIPRRGVAWVFKQENNPFASDKWNATENKKIFRKTGTPFNIPNYNCTIHFDDWDEEEKREYLKIRNEKRLTAVDGSKTEKKENHGKIKQQRDTILKFCLKLSDSYIEVVKSLNCDVCFNKFKEKDLHKKLTHKAYSEVLGINESMISLIRNGLR